MSTMQAPDLLVILETALLCARRVLSLQEMRGLVGDQLGAETVHQLLVELAEAGSGRGMELVALKTGWRLQSRNARVPGSARPRKAIQAFQSSDGDVAIIAYRQPVTRGDIEAVRGVAVATQIIEQLELRGWVETVGDRSSPGRPHLWTTTDQYLDDLGLSNLEAFRH